VPGAGPAVTARSPLRWAGEYGEPGAAPVLGQDTDAVLTEVLGLGATELGGLRDRGVIT
jgi:2-methylfumaryl-CoA isomerase